MDVLITNGRKCDCLVINCNDEHLYFIEFKGVDLASAAEQIYYTINALNHKFPACTINSRIVVSRVSIPDLRSAYYIKLEKLIKKVGGSLKKKEKIMEETI